MNEFYDEIQEDEIPKPEPEFEPAYNKHYITTDAQGRITACWSDGPHPERDVTDAICINDKGGYQFRLAPGGEENPSLWDMDGIPLYKWDGEQVLQRTEEELEADRAALPEPPPSGNLEGRVTALETDKADRSDVRAVWDQMAAAYSEGVQTA